MKKFIVSFSEKQADQQQVNPLDDLIGSSEFGRLIVEWQYAFKELKGSLLSDCKRAVLNNTPDNSAKLATIFKKILKDYGHEIAAYVLENLIYFVFYYSKTLSENRRKLRTRSLADERWNLKRKKEQLWKRDRKRSDSIESLGIHIHRDETISLPQSVIDRINSLDTTLYNEYFVYRKPIKSFICRSMYEMKRVKVRPSRPAAQRIAEILNLVGVQKNKGQYFTAKDIYSLSRNSRAYL
jgi:hypothetical protein